MSPEAWKAVLKRFQFQPASFIADSAEDLVPIITSNMASRPQACTRALRFLLSQQGGVVAPLLVAGLSKQLQAPRALRATEQDLQIMATTDGQLWHTALRKE